MARCRRAGSPDRPGAAPHVPPRPHRLTERTRRARIRSARRPCKHLSHILGQRPGVHRSAPRRLCADPTAKNAGMLPRTRNPYAGPTGRPAATLNWRPRPSTACAPSSATAAGSTPGLPSQPAAREDRLLYKTSDPRGFVPSSNSLTSSSASAYAPFRTPRYA